MHLYNYVHEGTANLVQKDFTSSGGEIESLTTKCNKDTSGKERLRMWSRGHLFIVRCCGHIDMWRPLYKYVYSLYVSKQCVHAIHALYYCV